MKTRVVLTVDTEPSIAGAFDRPESDTPLLHEPVWGEADGESQALGFMIRTLQAHNLVATFFVETTHTSCFSPSVMGEYVRRLTSAGQDVQLHLHPSWCSFREGRLGDGPRISDHCSELGEDKLAALIREGCDIIETWTGRRPTGMRTGNFSTSLSVFRAMRQAGLDYASNICTAVSAPPEEELRVTGGVYRFAGITELPVTCFFDLGPVGRGRLRPMQITALSAAEHIGLLNQCHDKGMEVAMIVTHPFEFIKVDNYRYENIRANRLVQKRLEKVCRFLDDNRDRFEVVPLAEAASRSIEAPPAKLQGSPLLSTLRAVENFTNDRFL
ncbi:hypothetical protein [Emcibacter sp.]|uniref:hypothetical protein n=1 Tax=Emcibacter sp. TaxID=1979954 RepID=UPI003A917162